MSCTNCVAGDKGLDESSEVSQVEYLTVQLFREEQKQLNQTINILVGVAVIFLVGWVVTLKILKKALKRRDRLKQENEVLSDSIKLSQTMLKLHNSNVLNDDSGDLLNDKSK